MVIVHFGGMDYPVAERETVLDALLRAGVQHPHSCKAGACGSCLLRVEAGVVPPRSQEGLKATWKTRGYFLPCVCQPDTDLSVALPGVDARAQAIIVARSPLSEDVMEVRLTTQPLLDFRAGQYVTLVRCDGLARSYSIASLPVEGVLAIHVRLLPDGRMSTWLHRGAQIGELLDLLGPSGECFYLPGREDQPLLLAGTGTGLGPLYGIVKDALAQGHRGPIHLFHGAVRSSGLYLVDELRALAARHSQFEYTPAVLHSGPESMFVSGALDQLILARFPKLTGFRGFLCGDPALVRNLKKKFFVHGMAFSDIHADAFLTAAAP